MTETGLAAVVLAAGESTRMGRHKPLLPMGDQTVVERAIALFQAAGIADIRVVVGRLAERTAPVVRKAGARAVVNAAYAGGMFTSVLAGVRSLDSRCRGFFMLPVDVPLVRLATIERLADAWGRIPDGDAPSVVLHPTFQGLRGHPPLIDAGHIQGIAAWRGDGGLRAYFDRMPDCAREIPVADRFILADMDRPEDYRQIVADLRTYGIPSPEECRALMVDILKVPPLVWRHCRAVAETAIILAQAVNRRNSRLRERGSAGGMLRLDLIRAAALVHDLARNAPDHAGAGAEYLRNMGFGEVADIVAVHMELPPDVAFRAGEAGIVFLADKLVEGDTPVTLEERFTHRSTLYEGDPDATAAVARRLAQARAVQNEVERRIGRPVAAVLNERCDDLPDAAWRD